MKKILIAGGAGFVGSHLCNRFIEKGFYVYCLDNLYTGRKSNISHLLNHDNFEFIEHDILNPIDIEVDYILNMACPASPPHYQKKPIETFKISVIGTMNLLDLAKKNNARILQASTSEVYGDPLKNPQVETDWGNVNPIGIRSCYDEGKRGAETLCMDYHREYGVDVKIIRIFNTYGPNMRADDGRVVSNFICQAIQGKDLTIYGEGTQTRSFQFVSDLVNGIEKMLLESPEDFTGPVNLGNPHEFTMLELAGKILELVNGDNKLVFQDLPEDDPKQRKPDNSLAKEKLNWEPTIQLEEGLKHTIEYFKKEASVDEDI